MSDRRPRLLPRPPAPIAAALFLGFTLLAVIVCLFAPWQPRADFDVTGILYLTQSAGSLLAMTVVCSGALVSLGSWVEAARKSKR